MTNIARYVHSLIQPAVETWFVEQCRNPAAEMYAYYKPVPTHDKDTPGAFVIGEQPPTEEWLLVAEERVRTDWTQEQVQRWLYGLAQCLPILPAAVVLAE